MKKQEYIKNVVTLKLDTGLCIGCALCEIVCPHAVFKIENKKALIIDKDACMECGACQKNCSVDAIKVDSGVGCAAGIIAGAILGTEATCDCFPGSNGCC
jgi:NAD-dependent dihydropyrimidine dehydrogenase PreA subunit